MQEEEKKRKKINVNKNKENINKLLTTVTNNATGHQENKTLGST